jgi:hypothetical protein
MKNNKKQWKKQHWSLIYILVFQTMSFPFNFIFWFGPIEFPFKLMPCKCHFKFVWIGSRSSPKGLRSNLWLLIHRITPFCCTFVLKHSFKVPFRVKSHVGNRDKMTITLGSSITKRNLIFFHPFTLRLLFGSITFQSHLVILSL